MLSLMGRRWKGESPRLNVLGAYVWRLREYHAAYTSPRSSSQWYVITHPSLYYIQREICKLVALFMDCITLAFQLHFFYFVFFESPPCILLVGENCLQEWAIQSRFLEMAPYIGVRGLNRNLVCMEVKKVHNSKFNSSLRVCAIK